MIENKKHAFNKVKCLLQAVEKPLSLIHCKPVSLSTYWLLTRARARLATASQKCSCVADKKVVGMVRAVTEDQVHCSIEFNEFLQMISRQETENLHPDLLVEAFKYQMNNILFIL